MNGRKGLTRNEKLSALAQLKDIEQAIGALLMETLNGKIAAADLDRLNRMEMSIRKFRWKIEDYPELAERLTAEGLCERRELAQFWKRLSRSLDKGKEPQL